MSRQQLEMYCAKAPTGTGVILVDGGYVFDSNKIGVLAARLVEQQRDEVALGVWRVHIARGEGWRTRIPSTNLKNMAVIAEIEHLILEALTVKCVSGKKSGFSFDDYHVIEMEILEALGYFIKYEKGWTAPVRWQARQLKVLQGELKPKKGVDKIVTCGPMRRLRFMRRWKVKTSRTRNVTWTPPDEVYAEMKIPLAQAYAHRLVHKIGSDRVGNTDHTMVFVRLSDSNKLFISGFGNGGLKKLQGDGATFTSVPLDINGVCVGSFDIIMSKANKGKGDRFSPQAEKTISSLGLTSGISKQRDRQGKLSHVSYLTCSYNGWMQRWNCKAWISFITVSWKAYCHEWNPKWLNKPWLLVVDGWVLFKGGESALEQVGLQSMSEELWKACRCYLVNMGPLTHIAQPWDTKRNSLLKSSLNEATKMAPNDPKLKRFFQTRTGNAKAGSQYVSLLCLQELYKVKWPLHRRSNSMKEGYEWGGWTLDPSKPADGDKNFLANYFGYKIGEKPKHAQQDRTMRGIDPRSASYEDVSKIGKKPGRKPVVAGTKVHNFNRSYMNSIFEQLERAEDKEFDMRPKFLEATRRLSKKWAENARKSIKGQGLSKTQQQHALWAYINNRENGLEAEKELKSKDEAASSEVRSPERVIERMGHQLELRDARRIDFMLESAVAGLSSGKRDAVTKKFLRVQARKNRLVGKVHRSRKRAAPCKQLDIRQMIAKRFKRNE